MKQTETNIIPNYFLFLFSRKMVVMKSIFTAQKCVKYKSYSYTTTTTEKKGGTEFSNQCFPLRIINSFLNAITKQPLPM